MCYNITLKKKEVIVMPRDKFKFESVEDTIAAYWYLSKKADERLFFYRYKGDENREKEAKKALNEIFSSAFNSDKMTKFCEEFLERSQYKKLMTALRQKRKIRAEKEDSEKAPKQITIKSSTHSKLIEFSKRYNITIDEAINRLCENITE